MEAVIGRGRVRSAAATGAVGLLAIAGWVGAWRLAAPAAAAAAGLRLGLDGRGGCRAPTLLAPVGGMRGPARMGLARLRMLGEKFPGRGRHLGQPLALALWLGAGFLAAAAGTAAAWGGPLAAPQKHAAAPAGNRHPAAPRRAGPRTPRAIRGEPVLACNGTVSCPCVISLGNRPPTAGACRGRAGSRADAAAAFDGPVAIPGGRAGGRTGLFAVLVSTLPGAERAAVAFTTGGAARRPAGGRRIDGEVAPVRGAAPGRALVETGSRCRVGPDFTAATATRGRVRAVGRAWDLDGRAAAICAINWKGPGR